MVNAETSGAVAKITALEAKMKQTTTTSDKAAGSMGKFGTIAKTGAAAGVAALAYGLYKSSQKAAEFEQKMSSLGAVAEASKKQMHALEKQALAMGSATAFSATQVADAQTELAKGGLKVGQILNGGLKSALSLAAAGQLDLSLAAGTTVNAMKLFGLQGKDTMKIADGLATAANRTTADVSDFAMALSQGGAVAKQVGYSFNDTVVVLEALAEAGVKNSDAGTSMKTAMIQLLRPTDKQAKLAKLLGINWMTQNGQLKDAAGLSKEVRDATEDMTKAERGKTLAVLAGTDGFRTLAALYDEGPAKLDKLAKANEKQGTAAKVAAQKQDNLKGDMEKFQGAVETLEIKIGQKLNPTVRIMVQRLTDAVAVFSALNSADSSDAIERLTKKNHGLGKAAEVVKRAFGVMKAAVVGALKIVINFWKNAVALIEGTVLALRGDFDLVIGLLTGDWRQAWKGAKEIVRGALTAVVAIVKGTLLGPVTGVVKTVCAMLKAAFGSTWNTVEDIFATGANKVVGFINAVISAINKIPGVDIGSVGELSIHSHVGDEKSNKGNVPGGHATHRQRGGMLFGGKPSGDSIPAMLERGEYVLNRKAVQAVGTKKLDDLNFKKASRFQTGGPVGLISGGDVVGAAKDAANAALHPASAIIGKLPKPNLPQPFTGVGPFVLDAAKDYIKSHVASIIPSIGGSKGPAGIGTYNGLPMANWVIESLKYAASKGVAPPPTSGYRSHAYNVAQGRTYFSEHEGTQYPHGAVDFGGYTTGFDAKMSVVNATKDFKYPLLAPIGFSDDGHASGTGHQKGGLIGRLRKMMSGGAVVKAVGEDLISKHEFNLIAASGIIGNAYREAGPALDTKSVGTGGGGLWGFTTPPISLADLQAAASAKGVDWGDPKFQTHFMLKHGGFGLRGKLNAASSPESAAEIFMTDWERPGIPALGDRQAGARKAYDMLKNSDFTAGGSSKPKGPSPSQKRKGERHDILDKLKKAVGSADTKLGKKTALFDYISTFAKYGELDPGIKAMIAGNFKQAAGSLNPDAGIGKLRNLANIMENVVPVSGDKDTNDKFVDRLKDIKARADDRAGSRRKTILAKLADKGLKYPFKDKLHGIEGIVGTLQELADNASTVAGNDSSPGGADLTDAEVQEQVGLNQDILRNQNKKRHWLVAAIAALYGKETNLGNQLAAAPSWKRPGFRKALKNTRLSIGSLSDNMVALTGLSGSGGEIFQTKQRLAELGSSATLESTSAASRDSELLALMKESLAASNRNLAIANAQMPIFQQFMPKFHTGGIVPGTGERPAMVMGGEGVFTRDQMAAMGGTGEITVNVVVEDGAVDSSRIRAEVVKGINGAVTSARLGNHGPKYSTAGRV